MTWDANTPGGPQYAQVKLLSTSAGQFRGPLVRASATDFVYLEANQDGPNFGIYWYNGGSWTQIGSTYSATPAVNDIVRLEANGSAFEGFVNGTSRIAGSNGSAPSTGKTGIYHYQNSTGYGVDDFEGGDLGVAVEPGPGMVVGSTLSHVGAAWIGEADGPPSLTNVGNIASAAAFGSPSLAVSLSLSGLAGAEAFGIPVVSQPINLTNAGNIGTAAAFGTVVASPSVVPLGVATGAGFGAPSLAGQVVLAGIASGQALGTPTASVVLSASGIASAGAIGAPALVVVVSSTGIATGAAIGQPSLAGAVNPSGVGATDAYGSPALLVTVACVAIGSAEIFGQPTVAGEGGAVDLSAVGGIASAAAFGSGALAALLQGNGIASVGAFGTPSTTAILAAVGIETSIAFGQVSLRPLVTLAGIASGELFGSPYTIAVSPGTALAEILFIVEGSMTAELVVSPSEAEVVLVDSIVAVLSPINEGIAEGSVELLGSVVAEIVGGQSG